MSKVAVLDYGTSNLRSVAKALEFVAGSQHDILVTDQRQQILAADRIVFPGQGAVGQCMHSLKESGLDEVIKECISNKPFLGICLGLQSLMQESDEDGGVKGLGIIPGNVVRFPDNIKDEHGDVARSRTWAGTVSINKNRILYGKILKMAPAFILSIATMCKQKMTKILQQQQTTQPSLLQQLPGKMYSPHNFIRKKVNMLA